MRRTELSRLAIIRGGCGIGWVQMVMMIVRNRWVVGSLGLIKVEELGIGESSEIIVEVESVRLLGREVLFGWNGVEVGEVLRDIGSLPPRVGGHGRKRSSANAGMDVAIERSDGVLMTIFRRSMGWVMSLPSIVASQPKPTQAWERVSEGVGWQEWMVGGA